MTTTDAPAATTWPEADRLFRGTRWRGADDAYTVDLGGGRSLWLFGDSFVADHGVDSRAGSRMLHNTLGLQTGSDPTTAGIEFLWRETPDGPADYFPGDDAYHYLWPGHGARLGDNVIVFFMRVGPPADVPSGTGFWDVIPFSIEGWEARLIRGIDGPPATWTVEPVTAVPASHTGIVGPTLVRDGEWLYAYSYDALRGYLCRFPAAEAAEGDLTGALWWDGAAWVADATGAAVVIEDCCTEFTVHRQGERWCLTDVYPFASPDTAVCLRWSDSLTGPWTPREAIHPIEEVAREGVAAYAGKAHPELTGGDGLLVTYATNTAGLDDVIWTDETIYYPRFVRARV